MKRLAVVSITVLIILFGGGVQAQAPEQPGPFPVGWRDVIFDDEQFAQGAIQGRLYYPALITARDAQADPSGGPYPVVAFQHGWLGRPADYDLLSAHIASWGFVVASTGTETGLFPDHQQFALDTRSFLHWVDAESDDPLSWLAGMAGEGPWAAVGHSMGGGVLHLLIGYEPRVQTIVGLQAAWEPLPAAWDNIQNYTGNALYIAGGVDRLVSPKIVYDWFESGGQARRDFFMLVEGMGHSGCTDSPPRREPLPAGEQHRMHRRLVTGFLRAELHGEENLYADLLGQGIEMEPVIRQARCQHPPLWVAPSLQVAESLVVGIAGLPESQATLAWSLAPAAIPTPFGNLGLDPDGAVIVYNGLLDNSGIVEHIVPVEPDWDQQPVYFQGLIRQDQFGRFSRVIEYVESP